MDEEVVADAEVGLDPRTRAEDLVRTRLHMGVPPAELPLAISNETGVAVEVVRALVDERLAADAAVSKRHRRAWWIVGAIGVVVGFGLDQLLGTSRGIGTALLVLAVAIGAGTLGWLISQIRG